MKLEIAPSILSADFGYLAEAIASVERGGADLIHIDVMDGRFVPNITIGIPIVESIKRVTQLPLDVHLMIIEAQDHIQSFVNAGASMISVHVEANSNIVSIIEIIKSMNIKAGIALNPSTPISRIDAVLGLVDYVVVMSVNPGFSGQSFIPETAEKIEALHSRLQTINSNARIEVDGGIHTGNAANVVRAGANILVAASAIYKTSDPTTATQKLRACALQGQRD